MSEHHIRLRGGWNWDDPRRAPGDPPPRVTLPLAWPAEATCAIRLVRLFQRPPIDPSQERLELRLAAVSGLAMLELNEHLLRPPLELGDTLVIELPPDLPSRNRLVLTVHGGEAALQEEPWGEIALVVCRQE